VSYEFGDSDRAAQRLALVARVFEPASRAFLAEAGRRGGALALDLGCGPGHTTELVASAIEAERCVGLDASPAYVTAAKRRAPAGCEFLCHDVLAAPYPTGRADTIYARFLVTHLADPPAAIAVFASQLAPGGRLLLDEVESITSDGAPFQRYLALVSAVLASQQQCLFVGDRIAAIAARAASLAQRAQASRSEPKASEGDQAGERRPVNWRARASSVRELCVDPRDAAGMFSLNWETLREHAAVAARTTASERDQLAEALAALRDGETPAPPITWGLRQVVFEV
jgi:trans-aconitate 2-methyltransferase